MKKFNIFIVKYKIYMIYYLTKLDYFKFSILQ